MLIFFIQDGACSGVWSQTILFHNTCNCFSHAQPCLINLSCSHPQVGLVPLHSLKQSPFYLHVFVFILNLDSACKRRPTLPVLCIFVCTQVHVLVCVCGRGKGRGPH